MGVQLIIKRNLEPWSPYNNPDWQYDHACPDDLWIYRLGSFHNDLNVRDGIKMESTSDEWVIPPKMKMKIKMKWMNENEMMTVCLSRALNLQIFSW